MVIRPQLNNTGPGTSIVIDSQNSNGSGGTITYYYESGVDDAADAAAVAAFPIEPFFPGTTIPHKRRTVQKRDGGKGLVVDFYQYRAGQSAPQTWSNLLYNLVPASYTIPWWGDAPTGVPSDANIISSGYGANGFDYVSADVADEAGLYQWNYRPEAYRILIPTEISTQLLLNANYMAMLGCINNANFSIGGTTFAKGTLLLEPASMSFQQKPAGFSYDVVYSFLARRDGHYDQVLESIGGSPGYATTFKYKPRYPLVNFNPLPYYT